MPVKFYVEPKDGFAVPFGFKITKQSEAYEETPEIPPEISPEDFHVPIKTLESFKDMQKLGFLDDPSNKIYFSRLYSAPESRNSYRIVFGGFDKGPRISINARTETVSSGLIPSLGIDFDKFVKMTTDRFAGYDFTPENGWEFMFYVDFLTSWKRSWSDSEIRILDSLKSSGTSMNTLAVLINSGIPVNILSNFMGLPDSWISKIATQNK